MNNKWFMGSHNTSKVLRISSLIFSFILLYIRKKTSRDALGRKMWMSFHLYYKCCYWVKTVIISKKRRRRKSRPAIHEISNHCSLYVCFNFFKKRKFNIIERWQKCLAGKKSWQKREKIQEAVNPTADIPLIHSSAAKMKTRVLESNGG